MRVVVSSQKKDLLPSAGSTAERTQQRTKNERTAMCALLWGRLPPPDDSHSSGGGGAAPPPPPRGV